MTTEKLLYIVATLGSALKVAAAQTNYEPEIDVSSLSVIEVNHEENIELLKQIADSTSDSHLSPVEIKRKLKYTKNPMEIKQLNRQLAQAYKESRQIKKQRAIN